MSVFSTSFSGSTSPLSTTCGHNPRLIRVNFALREERIAPQPEVTGNFCVAFVLQCSVVKTPIKVSGGQVDR